MAKKLTPSVPKLFKSKWCSNPIASKTGVSGFPASGSESNSSKYIVSVGMASKAATDISALNMISVFVGISTSHKATKITIYCALIISQSRLSEPVSTKFRMKFKMRTSCVPELSVDAAFYIFAPSSELEV